MVAHTTLEGEREESECVSDNWSHLTPVFSDPSFLGAGSLSVAEPSMITEGRNTSLGQVLADLLTVSPVYTQLNRVITCKY